MPHPDLRWRALTEAAGPTGLTTRALTRTVGIADATTTRALRDGRLTRLHRGVAAVRPAGDLTTAQAMQAAVRATRGGVVGGHSAARLWGLDGARVERPELILAADDTREQPRGIRLSWRALPAGDVTTLGALSVTTVARTAYDLCRRESLEVAVPLLDSALHQRLLHPAELSGLVHRLPRRSRRAALLADGRAESVFESVVRVDLTLGGCPPDELQYSVTDAAGRFVARVDLAWPSHRLIVELDGFATHGSPAALAADLRRQNLLVAAGWTVLRFAWVDRRAVLAAVLAHLRRAA